MKLDTKRLCELCSSSDKPIKLKDYKEECSFCGSNFIINNKDYPDRISGYVNKADRDTIILDIIISALNGYAFAIKSIFEYAKFTAKEMDMILIVAKCKDYDRPVNPCKDKICSCHLDVRKTNDNKIIAIPRYPMDIILYYILIDPFKLKNFDKIKKAIEPLYAHPVYGNCISDYFTRNENLVIIEN